MVKLEDLRKSTVAGNPQLASLGVRPPLPQPNANISSLIRTSRWVALVLGISYGALRLRRLQNYEAGVAEAEWKEINDEKARQKKIKDEISRQGMIDLEKQVGT